MDDDETMPPIPRPALWGAAGLIAATFLASMLGGFGGVKALPEPEGQALERRVFAFEDMADGGILVIDAEAERTAGVLAPGGHGFIRGVMRGMARERKLSKLGPEAPFVLTRWSDGRVSIEDPETGRRIDLHAFGRDNLKAAEALLRLGRENAAARPSTKDAS